MSDKKHIDRLFQERFKDFEATPGDAVWENIEAQLNQKKKKRRVIPVWWRYAGVAALLLLLLTVGFQLFNNDNEIPTNQVVETEDATSIELKTNDSDALDDSNNINSDTNNTVIADTNTENEALNNEETHQTKLEEASDNVIKASKTTSVAENVSSKNKNESKLNTASVSNEKFNASILNTENKTAIASNSEEKNKTIHQNKTDKSLIDKNKLDTISAETNKINNAIAEVKKEEKTELIADNNSIENTLTIEEELNKNKDIIEEEKNLNRWSVAANAAPVYFNSLGNGSSIDAQFNNNPKSSDLNMSYGIKASYAVNKKLRIRSGINKVNLGYSTNNVVVFQSIGSNSSSFQNVNSSGDVPENVSIISGANLSSAKAPDAFAKSSILILRSFRHKPPSGRAPSLLL